MSSCSRRNLPYKVMIHVIIASLILSTEPEWTYAVQVPSKLGRLLRSLCHTRLYCYLYPLTYCCQSTLIITFCTGFFEEVMLKSGLWVWFKVSQKYIFQVGEVQLPAVKHVVKYTLFHCFPINVSTTRVDAFITGDTNVGEKRNEVTDALNVSKMT